MNLNNIFNLRKYLFRPKVYFILFFILFIFSTEVLAAEWVMNSSIGLRNQYDTNRTLTTAPHDSVTGVSIIPSIDFAKNTEITRNRITARLQSSRYSDEDIRDSDVQILAFRHETKGLRNTFNITGNYRRDTTFATLTDIEFDDESGLGDSSDSDEGLTKTKAKRKDLVINPEWSYRMSESYSLGLSYRYRNREYSGDANTGLVEFNANAYAFALDKVLDQKNAISYIMRFSEFNPTDNTKTEDTSIGLTYRYKFTELSGINLVVGLRNTDSPDGNSDGSIYKISFNTRSEITRFYIDISRDLAGSGTGSVVERVQLDVRYNQRLTELTALSIRARAFDNKSVDNNTSSDRTYMLIEPRLNFRLSRNFRADVSYRYRYEKFDNSDQSADSNAIFLGIIYSFDKLNF